MTAEGGLPAELDFFKYAKGGAGTKRKVTGGSEEAESIESSGARKEKKRKMSEDREEGESGEEDGEEDDESAPPRLKHRVTAKGKNVPVASDKFEDMARRYHIPPLIMSNLEEYGYKHPTGIQAHGIPILMEVRILYSTSFLCCFLPFSSTFSPATSLRYLPQELGKRYPISFLSCPN